MKTTLLISFALLPLVSQAQIQVTGSGGPYTQNFDSLTRTTPAGSPWVDNVTLPGWYASTTFMGYGTNLTFDNTGPSGSTDRALGAEPDYPPVLFGARFVNGSGGMMSGFSVTYDGEQWQSGGSLAPGLVFSYRIFSAGAGSISALNGWVDIPALNYNGSVYTFGILPVDGNQAANRQAGINSSITGINLAPGEELWIRWSASDNGATSVVLAVDNLSVSFTAIPEPAAYTALLGCAALLLARSARRRKHDFPHRP